MSAPLRISSASGVPLQGTKLVRVTYMDKSGVSPREPTLVEAAVIIHGDDQVIPVEEYLERLVAKHIPEEKRNGFVFHAAEIFGGGDKKCIFHNKEEWPEDRRLAILDDLVAVPHKFGLPVCVGIVKKDSFRAQQTDKPHTDLEMSVAIHAMAIIQCEIGVELWMRANTRNEITHLIAENNNDVRIAAKEAHMLLRGKDEIEKEGLMDHPCFPFVRIRDGLQFTTKEESRLLQIADICAWSVRRAVNKVPNFLRFYDPIYPQIVRLDAGQVASLAAQL